MAYIPVRDRSSTSLHKLGEERKDEEELKDAAAPGNIMFNIDCTTPTDKSPNDNTNRVTTKLIRHSDSIIEQQ